MCIIKRKVSEIVMEIPKFQRITDMNRVEYIFSNINKKIISKSRLVFPGCIIFAKSPYKTWIIDGLHRLEVYRRILKELNIDFEINCDEIDVKDEEEAREIFNMVNDTRMLPDMPDGVDTSNIKKITSYLSSKYPKIFSNSKTGRVCRPHIHFNGLQEALVKIDKNIPLDAIERIETLNTQVMEVGFSNILKNEDVSSFVDSANKKGGFYLGIIPDYKWLDILFNGENKIQYKKKHIPHKVRIEVWKKYNKEIEGKCYICKDVIHIDTFHCGHDIAEINGGQTILSNLKPICSSCNLSMGTQNMETMLSFFK